MPTIDGQTFIQILVAYIKDQEKQLTHDARGLGSLEAYNNIIELCNRTIEHALNACKYCEAYPCRCEELDARRKYGRAERWANNGY